MLHATVLNNIVVKQVLITASEFNHASNVLMLATAIQQQHEDANTITIAPVKTNIYS